ncbi:hypothetical protein [Galbitalea soli]|uniref:Uncharacterized protein n=1 Tax=Galbitalea soli TaxID=1268042 RepID=A0A7C9PMI0_9MICO|nr:hypothetical protein [Galbitalea soli]NEM90846.1 hypothetical protein [Galbitalea soli]NYJ31566.1 hypothetical protein [Galbitalea soli]
MLNTHRKHIPAIVCGILASILIAGCSDAPPRPLHLSPPPTHSITPTTNPAEPPLPRQIPVSVASTDADVFAAAAAAYTGYVKVDEELLKDSKLPASAMLGWTTPQFGASEIREVSKSRDAGRRLVGNLSVSEFHLLSRKNVDGRVRAVLFACADASHSKYLESNGRNARPADAALRIAVKVDLRQLNAGSANLLVNDVIGVARVGKC